MNVVEPGDVVALGAFKIEFIKVNHSIAGACALAYPHPGGHGDSYGRFQSGLYPGGRRADQPGALCRTWPERRSFADGGFHQRRAHGLYHVRKKGLQTFNTLFERAQGRIIIAMFASNIHRIQSVVDSAVRFGRKDVHDRAQHGQHRQSGHAAGRFENSRRPPYQRDDIDRYDDSEICVLTTGSQGEPMSGLSRMAFAEHRKLEIRASDMVIVSASAIPGNEKSVSRVINQLVRTGADVIYEALAEVHVSGHARREELKLMQMLVKPRFFIPVHGEYRHLYHHARLAEALGMPEGNVHIPEIGEMIKLSPPTMSVAGTVPSGSTLIDGLGVGDVGAVVLKDRKHLAEDGLLIVVMGVDHEERAVVSGPDIIAAALSTCARPTTWSKAPEPRPSAPSTPSARWIPRTGTTSKATFATPYSVTFTKRSNATR